MVEEIEGLGRSQLEQTESLIVLILEHVAKAVSRPQADPISHWRTECVAWHRQLRRSFSPSMRQKIDMDTLWQDALKQAEAALDEYRAQLSSQFLGRCPVSLDDLLSNLVEFRDIVSRVAQPPAG